MSVWPKIEVFTSFIFKIRRADAKPKVIAESFHFLLFAEINVADVANLFTS